MTGIVTLYRQ